jgi:beta-galactosidase
VGQELPDEQVLIFGDPRVGTPLMREDPRVGYELPLRVLVWDAGGETHVAYRPPTDLADEYRLSARTEVLSRMTSLLEQLVAESTEP